MKTVIVAAVVAAAGSIASAQDLRIDLSTMVGTTAGNWNNISDLNGATGLIDFTTGAATGVTIAGDGNWTDFFGDDSGAFPNQDWVVQPATTDGAGLDFGETGTFTLSGLTASAYRVELVSARTEFGYLNDFAVGGMTADSTFLGTPVVTPWNSTTDGLNAGNWLIWSSVAPVGGEITISLTADAATLGILNAIRVVPVPAPGAGMALVIGAAFASRRRR